MNNFGASGAEDLGSTTSSSCLDFVLGRILFGPLLRYCLASDDVDVT